MSGTSNIREGLKLLNKGFGKYKPQILLVAVLSFGSALFEVIGVNAIIPLFSIISGQDTPELDFLTTGIRWIFFNLNIPLTLSFLLGFIVLLFIMKAVFLIAYNYVNIKITADYERSTREKLFRQTLGAKWPYLLQQKIGYLEKVLMNDIGHSTYLLKYISQAVLIVTSLAIYTFAAFNNYVGITLGIFVVGAIIFLLLKKYVYRTRQVSQEYADTTKEVAHHVNETMLGVKTIKAMNLEDAVAAKGKTFFDKLMALRIKTFFLQTFSHEMIDPVGLIFIVAVFGLSYQSPAFDVSKFGATIYFINKIFAYLQNAQMKLHSINEFIPYLKSSVEYQTKAEQGLEHAGGKKTFAFRKELGFKNVSFSYPNRKDVLSGASFAVKRGEMVGIIGSSGAGKTTIVDLLLKLFEPTGGAITLDGVNIKEISTDSWRQHIGYVSQDIFLLNDTVANNIRFYSPSVSANEISRAAKAAHIYEFIKTLPKGMNTIVGERGVMLSGGQRQRIILARVLAKQPELLILDEATSALDSESEQAIKKTIDELKGKVTVLVIAHRLSTVMDLDRLIAIDSGKIIEEGSPQELLARPNSYFAKVYNLGQETN